MMRRTVPVSVACACSLAALLLCICLAPAQKRLVGEPAPHNQDRPPGPALSPAEAVRKMTVPDGFSVEVVACEPDLVNPVAMTFDEKGRIWVVESLEYPRRSPGRGRDRVKILEDTDGDGKVDKVTVFADGLNIPSGIAVGHGGVWVANSPDILFYPIGADGTAGKPQVVVTGFGRDDTHELPNSLTWGPDGWLYGWNGVFNYSRVKQRGKEHSFTCAIFRIHPKTREFQLFCEGTSNPWGIAIDAEGSFFASACVIDHLWHLVETGYYHRQAGAYPPFTWKIESIVNYRHQKAAYCGIHYFDSDAYPPEYRDRLYMGNIHGGCINVDTIRRRGSTYAGSPVPDFLNAHDAWFMPVAQKTGPDGCLYILDWYDRYHCYQDANRDPAGIDRTNGRLYRVRYRNTPRAPKFDLAKESDDQLIARLASPNVYFRDTAQRLLTERASPELRSKLEKAILDESASRKARMHALWALVGGERLEPAFHQKLLAHADAGFRAWGVRAAGNARTVEPAVRERVAALASDVSPDVRLQVAIAARKVDGLDPVPLLVDVLAGGTGDDPLLPRIVWQNLHPLLETKGDQFLAVVRKRAGAVDLGGLLPRVVERLLAARRPSADALADLLELAATGRKPDHGAARQVLTLLAAKVHSGELAGDRLRTLGEKLLPRLQAYLKDFHPLRLDAAVFAATLNDPYSLKTTRTLVGGAGNPVELRLRALESLVTVRDDGVLDRAAGLLADQKTLPPAARAQVLAVLGRLADPRVATIVLDGYERMEIELRPRAIELLTERPAWAKALLRALGEKRLPGGGLNVNQARRLLASKDAELATLVKQHYGTVRADRNPDRERVVADMRRLLTRTKGDAHRGIAVFKKLCAQCHKLYGEGADVGPDITGVGRARLRPAAVERVRPEPGDRAGLSGGGGGDDRRAGGDRAGGRGQPGAGGAQGAGRQAGDARAPMSSAW
ncbi:MAG: PVC-type heme-binding CxxCH protein [Gemmataceae bacterium]